MPVSAEIAALDLPPPRWADLRRRLLSVAVLVPPVVFAIAMGGFVWIALVIVFGGILVWEWGRLCRAPGARAPGPPMEALEFAGLPAAADGVAGLIVSTLLFGLAAAWWAVWSRLRRRSVSAFWLPFGVVWLAAAAAALLSLRLGAATGFADTLFLCLVVVATDVGAYAVGRRLGGKRLAPTVSPNKTWSGAFGGLASAMAVGGVAGYALQPAGLGLPLAAVAIGGLFGVLAIVGDLFESWMKRRCDVKDTSGLLPGHGGLLDRLDGLLTAAPAAALLAYAAPQGLPLWVLG